MEAKTNNINFFKRIYFSISKIKKYGELTKEGVKKSTYYIMDLIVICSIIYASLLTLRIKSNTKRLQEYLERNFPNFTYEDNKLTSDVTERIVLNDELIKVNLGGQIIIDTITDYETVINEYKNVGTPSILLTTNKYVTINSQGNIAEYDYNEIIKQNTEEEQTTIDKEYFINMFSNISYSYCFFGYFIGSSIGTSIVVFVYNLIITGVAFAFCKIKKMKVKFNEIYSMGLHAFTIFVVGYFIMMLLPSSIAIYVQVISTFAPIVYLGYAIYINKWIMPENLS